MLQPSPLPENAPKRLLVLSAGSPPSNNLVRALKAGDPGAVVVGCDADRFVLKKSISDVNYFVPLREAAFVRALRRIVKVERIVIPNNEPCLASRVASARRDLMSSHSTSPAHLRACSTVTLIDFN